MSDVKKCGSLVVGNPQSIRGEVEDDLCLKAPECGIYLNTSLHRTGQMKTFDFTHKILQSCQERTSDEATLYSLQDVLPTKGLKNCSDAQKKTFSPRASSCIIKDDKIYDSPKIAKPSSSHLGTTVVADRAVDIDKTHSTHLNYTPPIIDSSLNKLGDNKTSFTVLKQINLGWQAGHLKTRLACIVLIVLSVFTLSYALSKEKHGFESSKSTQNGTTSWHIYVDSYLMYESKMNDVDANDVVYLHVSLKNPDDWVERYAMLKVEQITEITFDGSASITAIFKILKQLAQTVEGIILLGTNNNSQVSFCDSFNNHDSSFPISKRLLIMNSVRKLHLKIPFCEGIFKFLVKYTTFPSVTEFLFVLDNEWFYFVQSVFLSSKHSLQSVTINGLLSFKIFQKYAYNLPKLNSVTNLTLRGSDPLLKTDLSKFDTVYLFDSVFPEVTNLEVKDAILPLDNFNGLGELQSSLVTAKIGISVDKMIFDLNTIPLRITDMNLYVRFVSCGSMGNVPTFQGQPPGNSTLIISTNCNITAEPYILD